MATLPLDQRILNALKKHKKLTATGIAKRAALGKREKGRLFKVLDQLKKEGRILCEDGSFLLPARGGEAAKMLHVRVGTVHARFGFVNDEISGEELFVPGRFLLGALPGDRALLRERPPRGTSREGEIVEILEEADITFSGVFQQQESVCTVRPDTGIREALTVAPADAMSARDGDKVVARICRRSRDGRDHRAQVLAVLGTAQDPRACAAAVLRAQNIRADFEAHVEKEAERIARQGVCAQDLEARVDLRDAVIFTIDSASSKDLDDAISLIRLENGWEAGIHIADVSHYVRAKSPLDTEALERATSIYFADQVVPMLPQSLSNGICSLNPGEDRLTLSAFVTLDEEGDLVRYRFAKSVIRSRIKGIYSECNAILTGTQDAALLEKYAGLCDTLRDMQRLARMRQKKRRARGAIDLSSVESAFLFDEEGKVAEVVPRRQGEAENLIEEFMLLANQAAASLGDEKKIPFIYRVHEDPPPEKINALFELLERLGVQAQKPQGDVPPALLRDILDNVRGTQLEMVVNNQLLRSMAKARYSEKPAAHYGLTIKRYCHFTSPIRRYPDLAVHRILSEHLSGSALPDLEARYGAFAAHAAEHSSAREVRAMNVERTCDSCFAAAYMQRCIGQTFDGVIGSVVPHGLYVMLKNSVEGLVRLNSLEGDYDYDGAVTLTQRGGGGRYRVGDPVRVLVARADVSSGQTDFVLAP